MDCQGRVVLPKELRERAGLTPEQDLSISVEDGALVIRSEARRQALLLDQLRALARPGQHSVSCFANGARRRNGRRQGVADRVVLRMSSPCSK